MNINFKVIGLTRLGIKPESTAPEADALTTRPSELYFLISTVSKKNLTVLIKKKKFLEQKQQKMKLYIVLQYNFMMLCSSSSRLQKSLLHFFYQKMQKLV